MNFHHCSFPTLLLSANQNQATESRGKWCFLCPVKSIAWNLKKTDLKTLDEKRLTGFLFDVCSIFNFTLYALILLLTKYLHRCSKGKMTKNDLLLFHHTCDVNYLSHLPVWGLWTEYTWITFHLRAKRASSPKGCEAVEVRRTVA